MSKPLKPRRGTTAEQNAFVGEAYEITYDTDKNTIVCRDGKTPGGFPLAKSTELEVLAENIDDNVGTIREDTVAAAQEAIAHSAVESGSLTLEGVAAEVERKAALDLSNLSAAGRSLGAGLGMPKEQWVDMAVGATGTMYTAQKSGFLYARATSTAIGGFFDIYTASRIHTIQGTTVGNVKTMLMPLRKGEVYKISYANMVVEYYRFIYAEGEEA